MNSCTPFLVAAAHGCTDVVAILEEIKDKPIQADELDKDRKSAVYLAAEGAHLRLLRVYLKIIITVIVVEYIHHRVGSFH